MNPVYQVSIRREDGSRVNEAEAEKALGCKIVYVEDVEMNVYGVELNGDDAYSLGSGGYVEIRKDGYELVGESEALQFGLDDVAVEIAETIWDRGWRSVATDGDLARQLIAMTIEHLKTLG